MRILSIDGGGFLGLASAAFLQETERHFNTRCIDHFDLFCGTSTGAIIALALAHGLPASAIVTLYEKLGATVFPNKRSRAWKYTIGWLRPQYNSAPLRVALEETFGNTTLADLHSHGKKAIVAAFCVTTGHPRIFKTDHSVNLTAHGDYRLSDIALASSAAPTYFPLVELRNPVSGAMERFCDGGIFANSPALLGYAEAVYELRARPTDISLLSISTPRMDHGERPGTASAARGINRGLWGWAKSFVDITTDGTSAASVGALERIMTAASARHCRITLDNPDEVPIDLANADTADALRGIGATRAHQTAVRRDLYPFFSN